MLTEILREQTRRQHEELESANPLPQSEADYVRQLKKFFGFVEPWERAVAQALPADDMIRAGRQKTSWLEQDLEFFGINHADREQLPRINELPSLASRAEILGAAYVLEGSTLGGQVIVRHLEGELGLRDGQGYRYFRSYGPDVGAQWKAFRDELLRASSTAHDPVIVGAARETFEMLHRWFRQCEGGRS
ncbi:MAG TPA: biliverdin-producing heme oxygenase [Verrucomicrobiae bacterium]|nr:biliverdin-producing heme oxygenase [Verrucomicrobiae bacterium]